MGDDDDKKTNLPYERIKVMLYTKWEEGVGPDDPRDIITKIFTKDNPIDQVENLTKISDFQKYFSWNCIARHALMINKFWIKKDLKDGKYECSFTIKSLQIHITEDAPVSTSIPIQFSESLFADTRVPVKNKEKKDEDEDDEDEDDDDEEENDKKEEKTVVINSEKKNIKVKS